MRVPWLILLTLTLPCIGQDSASTKARDKLLYNTGLDDVINPDSIRYQQVSKAILIATNAVREERGLTPLIADTNLASAAGLQAKFLSKRKDLLHENRSSPKYRTPIKRVQNFAPNIMEVAENLARGSIYPLGKNGQFFVTKEGGLVDEEGVALGAYTYSELASTIVEGWMNSRGHRANILGDYRYLGVAVSEVTATDSYLTELVFVQNFGNY